MKLMDQKVPEWRTLEKVYKIFPFYDRYLYKLELIVMILHFYALAVSFHCTIHDV